MYRLLLLTNLGKACVTYSYKRFSIKKRMSHLEGIACTVAALSQWSSLCSHLMRAWRLEDLPGVDFQIQVPAQLLHSNDKTWPWGITLFKYLELFHLLLIAGSVPQKGGKKVVHLVTFLWQWKAPNMTNHILLLMNDCSTLLCSLSPALAERTWYKRSAYSDQWGGDLKLKTAIVFVLQAESKVKGNQTALKSLQYPWNIPLDAYAYMSFYSWKPGPSTREREKYHAGSAKRTASRFSKPTCAVFMMQESINALQSGRCLKFLGLLSCSPQVFPLNNVRKDLM